MIELKNYKKLNYKIIDTKWSFNWRKDIVKDEVLKFKLTIQEKYKEYKELGRNYKKVRSNLEN